MEMVVIARSIWSKQAEYLPFLDIKGNSFDGCKVTVFLDKFVDFENGWHIIS